MKKNNGFTFIEMLIVVGVMGVIMASILGVMTGAFRSQSRVKLTDKMNQTGVFVLAEIRKGIVNGISIGCPVLDTGTSSFGFVDRSNGEITNVVCYEGLRIASESANPVNLTNPDVTVINCGNFAKCNTVNSPFETTVTSVDINFILSTNINGVGLTRPYTSKIVIR